MTDWNKFMVRHAGTGTEFAVNEARLVASDDSESSDLYNVLSTFEIDVQAAEDRLRRHRDEHAVVQKFIDKIKGKLAEGDQFIIDDWDDFEDAFDGFDGFDLDRPRREWSAEVKLTVKVSVSGESDIDLDEDDIESLICDELGFRDIDVSVSFSYDNCEADDSTVEDYDVDSVDVTFND